MAERAPRSRIAPWVLADAEFYSTFAVADGRLMKAAASECREVSDPLN